MKSETKRTLTRVAKVGSAVLTTALSTPIALEASGAVTIGRTTLISLIVGGAAVSVLLSIESLVFEDIRPARKARTRHNLEQLCYVLRSQGAEQIGVRDLVLGVSVYAVRRDYYGEYLFRVLRIRQGPPDPSKIRWIRGRGVIGQAWLKARPISLDLRPLVAQHAGCTEVQFASLAPEDRAWLDEYWMFDAMIGKYREVWAVPLTLEHGDVVGVLALDLKVERDSGVPLAQQPIGLDSERLSQQCAWLSQSFARELAQMY